MLEVDGQVVLFEAAQETVESGRQIAHAGEGGGQQQTRLAQQRAGAPALAVHLAQHRPRDRPQVEGRIKRAADFFDGEHRLGHEGVVAGNADTVAAKNSDQLQDEAPQLLVAGGKIKVLAEGDGDLLFHRAVVGLGPGPGEAHADLHHLLGIVSRGGQEQVRQGMAQAAREVPGQAPVEQAEAAVVRHEHVAGVRVGVEEAADHDLVQQRRGPGLGQGVRLFRRKLRLFDPPAVHVGHHQQTAGRVLADNFRGEDLFRGGVLNVEILLVARLMPEIEFLDQPRANLLDDRRQVERPHRGDIVLNARGKEGDEIEIGLDDFEEIGALELDRDLTAVRLEPGEINLRQRGRGDGRFVEFAEYLGGIALQFLQQHFPHVCKGQGLDGVLELLQFEHERLRHEVGPHAQELAEFDERRAELLGRQADAFDGTAVFLRRGDEALPPGVGGLDLLNDLGETVAHEHNGDFLGPHGVGQQVERLEGDARHGNERAGGVRRCGRGRSGRRGRFRAFFTRASRASMRALCVRSAFSASSLNLAANSPLMSSNSLRPCSAIFSAMMRASPAETLPCRM